MKKQDFEIRGSGFVLGNSFIMSESKGFTWTIDVDYLVRLNSKLFIK